MKIKALLFGLLILAASAVVYTTANQTNGDQAIDKKLFKLPKR